MNGHKLVAAAEHDNRGEYFFNRRWGLMWEIDEVNFFKMKHLLFSSSVSAWVRDVLAVMLFCSKDGYTSIYCIYVESDRSPVVFSQISDP